MAQKKGQMFVVTAVFLTGLLFMVQQALISYSMLDMSEPFLTDEHYVFMNMIGTINRSIKGGGNTIDDCYQYEDNIDELIATLRDDYSLRGYLLETEHILNCTYWKNQPPVEEPPLRIGLSLNGKYKVSGVLDFYHKE